MTNQRTTSLWHSAAFVAVAMGVMNIGTYGFQIIAARALGPSEYGAVASLMAVLIVIAVLQLGLQATAARRIAGEPGHVAQIERGILRVSYRAALALGALMLLLSPLVWRMLKLDGLAPALLLALAAIPTTIMGGQAGILQGERRWRPLGIIYLGVGVSRVVIGTICVLISPTETSAMLGVTIAFWVPVAMGWWVLRVHRVPGETSDEHRPHALARETFAASVALLAFYLLSNIDIVVARNVLDEHDAGLYAGGLILTKAVLFLPQFVVVLAFPSMSTAGERRLALVRSLSLVAALGAVCTLGAWLMSGLALVFIGGSEYADVQSRLWLFAVLGTVLAMLQLLVYSVLARRGTRSTYFIWAAVVVLLVTSLQTSTLDGLLLTVLAVDTFLLVVLTAVSFWRLREPAADAESPVQLAG
ncbi:polysaccharide biosynthesis protein [Nocardioides sp. MAH-18]|uniref:Polysaccharide biosynthesis protein n=1 Tax=Nocardioides agri TaxID=2682843 RepID=A0A6L6XXV9_9ACTN|nr:polysaccharide biosynthesis protein [Nocardioides sp. CGMCC 1.13656]MBA2952373.1 polysaccharide biosynthesis protein [Nocardioides sp. CGMCC 1.13656]MVQ51533.1 polysaccharide biosynthesis protein [Nocardioides sp. MAH-18]